MASGHASVKILIAGGFGVGKTTFVGSVSEIEPLSTEAVMTSLSEGTDDTTEITEKTTTTVALDFGRRTFDFDDSDGLVLYLFGTPGQDRFWFWWNDLARGAVGAIVLADTRRLHDCFPAIDFFEQRGVPFVLGVNTFPGAHTYSAADLRTSLRLGPDVPVVTLDARESLSTRDALQALVEHRLRRSHAAV